MRVLDVRLSIGWLGLLLGLANATAAQLEPTCAANSPERHGAIGCSLVETKLLPAGLTEPLFWHVDRFESEALARSAVNPASVAFDAHGIWWLMTIESQISAHHGGTHVTDVKLPPLPPAPTYAMLVMSAYVPAGLTSRIHQHSGVEGFYVVDGEQCLETPERTYRMTKGSTLVVPTGVTMRLVATGSSARRALAVVVFDAAKPPTLHEENGQTLASCR